MDALESLIAMLLRHQGYWTTTSFKVELTKEEKRRIGRSSTPRWELDVIAYKGSTNEVLAVECKSFLDSGGVVFRNNTFEPEKRYKLFTEEALRSVVLQRVATQLQESGACAGSPQVTLCLAAGKIAPKSDRVAMESHFKSNGWLLFDSKWMEQLLLEASQSGYENDIAFVVSKILLRGRNVV